MDKYDAPADNFPKEISIEKGETTGYSVEARYADIRPEIINGQMFDIRFSRVNFQTSPMGISEAPIYDRELLRSGLFSFEAAQALRWLFIASSKFERSRSCLETRIIRHRIKYERSIEEIEAIY